METTLLTQSSITIAAHADVCFELFARCLTELADIVVEDGSQQIIYYGDWAEDQMTRFNIWASNLGVLAQGHASIEHRLRDCNEVYRLILQLLDALHANLLFLIEALTSTKLYTEKDLDADAEVADVNPRLERSLGGNGVECPSPSLSASSFSFSSLSSASDFKEGSRSAKLRDARTEVAAGITRLNKLSASIRQSGTHYRDAKAANFIDKDDFGDDLTSRYAVIATLVLDHMFPNVDEPIRKRIAETIAQRRNVFAYRRKHQKKLSKMQREIRPPPEVHHRDGKIRQGQSEVSRAQPVAVSESKILTPQKTILSATSASAPDPEELRRRMKATSSKASTVISGTTTEAGALAIPAPPKVDKNDVFECPYCFVLCPAREARGKYWRHHIMKDLAPYVCLFLECNKPQDLFCTFGDWISHIQAEHIPMEWQCVAPIHGLQSFDDKESYEEHMRRHHAGSFASSQLPILAHISARPKYHPFAACPFCNGVPSELAEAHSDPDTIDGQEALQKHIAWHLQSLALMSLTWLHDEESTSSTAEDRILDLSDSIASFIFHNPPADVDLDIWAAEVHLGDDPAWANGATENGTSMSRKEWSFLTETPSMTSYNGHWLDENLTEWVKHYYVQSLSFPGMNQRSTPKPIPEKNHAKVLDLLRKYYAAEQLASTSLAGSPRDLRFETETSAGISTTGTFGSNNGTHADIGKHHGTPVFNVNNTFEQEPPKKKPLAPQAAARKALMRKLVPCNYCRPFKIKCPLSHHAFRDILKSPHNPEDEALIEWVGQMENEDEIFEHQTYKEWSDLGEGILWIKSKPGFTRTGSINAILNRFQSYVESNVVLLYFFFDAQDVVLSQTALGMYRCLLAQLLAQVPESLYACKAVFEGKQEVKPLIKYEEIEWSLVEVCEVFFKALSVAAKSRTIRILLANLDEAREEDAQGLMNTFHQLHNQSTVLARISICYSSSYLPINRTELVPAAFQISLDEPSISAVDIVELPGEGADYNDNWQESFTRMEEQDFASQREARTYNLL